MHILHVVQLYHPVRTGAGRYFAEVGERLAAEGQHVTVLASDAYDLEHLWAPGMRRVEQREEVHNGVRIVRLPVRRLPGSPLLYPAMRRLMAELSRLPGTAPLLRRLATLTPRLDGLGRFLAAGRFDLVHATNITLDFAVLPAFAYARRSGVPFICTPFIHLGEPENDQVRRYYTMRHQIELLRRSDRVIVQGAQEERYLLGRGVPPERVRRIGVGVNPAELAGGDGARFRAGQRVSGALVLYVGALARDKGAIQLVEAMRRLWARGADATLALIGAPLAHFTRYYETLPDDVRARVRLLPYAPDQVKKDAYAAADVFAMPSRTDSFGIVYLEAWCYGVPVIGARAGGVPDVIEDGRDGLLVRFGDSPGLAEAIGRLLADPHAARRLGEAGRAKVLRELTWERKYAQVRAVYAELIED
ncbi:MAG TPA: glycosyltransferase family 4 protein [Roseiflexaceae bacterium]|nr:glycosyltransferase family 4 protein [Roseiflexaceae bacterium]